MTSARPRMGGLALLLLVVLAMTAQPALADTQTFSNSTAIATQTGSDAIPYPSAIDVSGMADPLTGATVTLKTWTGAANNVDVLLVSPTGKTVMLMSDVAAGSEGVDLTLDDAATAPVPLSAPPAGSYKPTDDDSNPAAPDDFDNGAPAQPFGTTMSALYGDSPNGQWKLYVSENTGLPGSPAPDGGGASGGWTLSLTTTPVTPPPPPPPPPLLPPDNTPPTPPPDTGSPDIAIQSAAFEQPPVAGSPSLLKVTARDPSARITGVIVNFGETLGIFAESACVDGLNSGGTVTFEIPYKYLAPGDHTITLTVLAGGCLAGVVHTTTFTVTVQGAGAARAHAAGKAGSSRARSSKVCPDALLVPSPSNVKRIRAALLCVMNQARAGFKLKNLTTSKRLNKAALAHTRAMIIGQFFAHQGPAEPALVSRLRRIKYFGAAGENIGAGSGSLATPAAMVDGWLHSPPHRANLLSKSWRTVGIGLLAAFPIGASAPSATYTTDFATKP